MLRHPHYLVGSPGARLRSPRRAGPAKLREDCMNIDSRLRRLEDEGRSGVCPECGLVPDERRPIAAVYPDEPDKGFQGDPHVSCEQCGHALYTVLRVVRDAAQGGGLT